MIIFLSQRIERRDFLPELFICETINNAIDAGVHMGE